MLEERETPMAGSAPPIIQEVLRSPGRPLDAATRAYMEPRFGHDFGQVRVHADSRAAESARALSAMAYTVGSHVVFGAGQYAPGTLAGRQLMAHELTHTIQQSTSSRLAVQRGVLSSLSRGWDMYSGMTDEGAPFARELMRWRILGLGADFVKDSTATDWNDFMLGRPEIQRAMEAKFSQMAVQFASGGLSPGGIFGRRWQTYNTQITNVRLNELESMRLTLHGCHRIDMEGQYRVTQEEGRTVVQMSALFTWVDRADLHSGVATQLASGDVVADREFTGAGWDYDVRIRFRMPSLTTWSVAGGTATHVRGWPPITGAPAAGWRG